MIFKSAPFFFSLVDKRHDWFTKMYMIKNEVAVEVE